MNCTDDPFELYFALFNPVAPVSPFSSVILDPPSTATVLARSPPGISRLLGCGMSCMGDPFELYFRLFATL